MSYRVIILVMLLVALGNTTRQEATAPPPVDVDSYRATLRTMVQVVVDAARRGVRDTGFFENLAASRDPLYAAPLIDAAFFLDGTPLEPTLLGALGQVTGGPGSWQDYFEWAGRRDIPLPPYYDEFKGRLLAAMIDPNFARFFGGVQASARINLVEVIWGGVRVDGIPSLVNARQITPREALAEGEIFPRFCRLGDCRYPADDELVFGVSLGGDARAYPLRVLNWHEMFNDVIGHTPMREAPGGTEQCRFRAPAPLQVLAQATDADGRVWVEATGDSAGCPERGWLAADALEFDDENWPTLLPDGGAEREPLAVGDGLTARVRGRPVMLAYCTLCGAGVLYDARIPDLSYIGDDGRRVELGDTVLEFGSTGLLMRSNKLMYDRTTFTVWNAITGVPAFGPLTRSRVRLRQLPVVVTDWASWLGEHPDSSVLSLNTGYLREYRDGAAYADYFNDSDLMFPVWQQDDSLPRNKEMVFALTLEGVPKAYPLKLLVEEGITHDELAGVEVIIITHATPERPFFEPGGAAVRAYLVGDHTFQAAAEEDLLIDESGAAWRLTEEALLSPSGERLERLPGHLAFWFGWYAFHPDTLVYEGR